jgi:DNA anti-recombination protein RmuC
MTFWVWDVFFLRFHAIYQTRGTYLSMQGETGERFRKLCEQAAVEQDSKLLELAKEINALLEEKEQRLQGAKTIKLTDVGSGDHAA